MNTFRVSLPSFAKINLRLQVLGKRDDNYHELRTILQTVSLHDDLTFVRRNDSEIHLTCSDAGIPTDRTNLINRAASVLRDSLQLKSGFDIHLEKRIPTKAGLGGASSNAAVTLLGLTALSGIKLTIDDLCALGRRLGADVSFFFTGGRALASGTGTEVSKLPDLPTKHLIIINPNAAISTAEAYKALNAASLTSRESLSILASSFGEPLLDDCDQWSLHNDFEAVIFEIEPEIERAKKALLVAGAQGALLAGSGSSVFGIFESAAARDTAVVNLRREAGWRVFPCETLSGDEYLKAFGSPLTLF